MQIVRTIIWVLLLVALVRARLGSPVLFRQRRPGLDGQPFEVVKFRTMTDGRGTDGNLLSDAQRLTPFGRFLRASSMDELPELWNVLKGDMSLVGPRPPIPEEVEAYHRALFLHHHATELERYEQQARLHQDRIDHLEQRLRDVNSKRRHSRLPPIRSQASAMPEPGQMGEA